MSPKGKSGMEFDSSEFDKRFFKLAMKKVPDAYIEAMIAVLPKILKDAIMEEPRAPHKTGHLWRSQKIELPKKIAKRIEATFGFNVPYAAATHEAPDNWNWTLTGSGPKYLEAKLIRNKEKYYLEIVSRARMRTGM